MLNNEKITPYFIKLGKIGSTNGNTGQIRDATGNLFVIEVNAAPSWKLIEKDCGVNVEEELLKFLAGKIV